MWIYRVIDPDYVEEDNSRMLKFVEEEFALVEFIVIEQDENSAVVEMYYPTLEEPPLTYLVLEDGTWRIDFERTILEQEKQIKLPFSKG